MTREQARAEIKARYAEYLQPAKKKHTFICPLCGNGTGADGDGLAISKKDPTGTHLKCFKCGFYGDIIELIKQDKGLATDAEAFDAARAAFNITVDGQEDPAIKVHTAKPAQEVPQVDFVTYMQQMAANIASAEGYLSSRGISLETAKRFMLGYDMRFSQGTGPDTWKALIIPTSRTSFVARNTDPEADKGNRYRKAGAITIFNSKALYNAEKRPVFVTEGELDALSIMEAGGLACALGSTSNVGKLTSALKARPTESTLLICMDNDDAGTRAAGELREALTSLPRTSWAIVNICGSHKDANDALCADPAALRAAIQAEEKNYKPGAAKMKAFLQTIRTQQYKPISTGLPGLDEIIGGGFLRQTIVSLGAAPGMGKSFFAQQLFEGMAQQGHSVLYFNFEMSEQQMISRSIAREARRQDNARLTAIDVLQGYKWTAEQEAQILKTAEWYGDNIAPYMAYNPAGSTAQLDAILDEMETKAKQAREAGKDAPLVVIDYLHLLRGDNREDTQATIKRAMATFKEYAMNYNSLVFVIMAFNRESNKGGKVSQESGRDSSSLEYGADLMLGLNFSKVEENTDSDLAEKLRDAAKGEIQRVGQTDYKLKVLKNRLQGGCGSLDLVFSGRYGLFLPQKDAATQMRIMDADLPSTRHI